MQSHSEKDNVKLDTLSQLEAHLIEDNVALPEDVFSSYPSYLLYELASYKPTMSIFMVLMILISLTVVFRENFACFIIFLASIVLICCLSPVAFCPFEEQISEELYQIKLLLEVITRKPAVRGREWRTITYNMNQYLFDNGLWGTPYYFYSEKTFYHYFLDLVRYTTFKTQEESPSSSSTDAQPGEPVAATSTPVPLYTKCILKAVETEDQAQKNYWRKQYPIVDTPS